MYYRTEMNALNFLGQKVKVVQGHFGITICWDRHCTDGGIQYWTSHVDFLVH